MNNHAPRLYGLMKLHKPNVPIRPVVSFVQSPSYKLAKFTKKIFCNVSKFIPKFGLKNSLQLIDKIKEIPVPHKAKLVSFDVKSLFTSIPRKKCLVSVESRLDRSKVNPMVAIELLNVIEVCLDQNYFQFQDRFIFNVMVWVWVLHHHHC